MARPKGFKLSPDVVEKIRAKLRGRHVSPSTQFKKGHVATGNVFKPGHTGVRLTGTTNGNWKGGIYPVNMSIRCSREYREWKSKILARDNRTCVFCGYKPPIGVKRALHVDHIRPFALHPHLRFTLSNGRTLCAPCHRNTDTWGARKPVSKTVDGGEPCIN